MKDYAYSFAAAPGTSTMYDLIGNITHESVWTPVGEEKHIYRAQVKDFSRDKWFVIQDLIVEELEKERMHLAESYIQVFVSRPSRKVANDRFGSGRSGNFLD
jgi:U4/U6.U5 tri-snRNP-associated protein 2